MSIPANKDTYRSTERIFGLKIRQRESIVWHQNCGTNLIWVYEKKLDFRQLASSLL
jgi:hypothetical protein